MALQFYWFDTNIIDEKNLTRSCIFLKNGQCRFLLRESLCFIYKLLILCNTDATRSLAASRYLLHNKMKTAVIQLLLPLLFVAPLVYAQTDVYVCLNPDGSRYYENRVDKVQGCKPVDMQAITLIPEPYKKAVAPKPKLWPQLSLGMTKTAVEKAWGKPSLTRRVQTREVLTEEWKYTSHAKLTFRNGTLEVIED